MAQGAGPLSAEPPAPTAALGKGSVAPSPYFWPKPQEKWQLVPGPSRTCCNRRPGWGVVWGQGGPLLRAPGAARLGAQGAAPGPAPDPLPDPSHRSRNLPGPGFPLWLELGIIHPVAGAAGGQGSPLRKVPCSMCIPWGGCGHVTCVATVLWQRASLSPHSSRLGVSPWYRWQWEHPGKYQP